MAILDTTALIDLVSKESKPERKRIEARIREKLRADDDIHTTRLNIAELLVGLHRSGDQPRRRARIDQVLDACIILEVTEATAARFGQLKAFLLDLGFEIGDFDTMIAAIAISNQQAVITRNVKHFSRVPGLAVEGY